HGRPARRGRVQPPAVAGHHVSSTAGPLAAWGPASCPRHGLCLLAVSSTPHGSKLAEESMFRLRLRIGLASARFLLMLVLAFLMGLAGTLASAAVLGHAR